MKLFYKCLFPLFGLHSAKDYDKITALIKKRIKPEDNIFILGDFCFHNKEKRKCRS